MLLPDVPQQATMPFAFSQPSIIKSSYPKAHYKASEIYLNGQNGKHTMKRSISETHGTAPWPFMK